MFVFQGRTLFIQSCLYHAFVICALYLAMNETNKIAVFHTMELKVAELIHESNEASWSIADNLAGVQALILVHIIQLFDGDIRQRALAEQHEAILVRWTDQLQMRTKNELVASTSPIWSSWIFVESLHRTSLSRIWSKGFTRASSWVSVPAFRLWHPCCSPHEHRSGTVQWETHRSSSNNLRYHR